MDALFREWRHAARRRTHAGAWGAAGARRDSDRRAGAFALSGLMASRLFGIGARDPTCAR